MGCCSSKTEVQVQDMQQHPERVHATPEGAKPPWELTKEPPPGIVMASNIPNSFSLLMGPSKGPFERLALISSRVMDPQRVVNSLLPNVAYIAYDWKVVTPQELMQKVKKLLAGSKVASIAVVAPGDTPGSASLMDGRNTSAENLTDANSDESKLWTVLSGHISPKKNEPGRIDFIACRVLEDHHKAALMLQALHKLSDKTSFTASDDALDGYCLMTSKEAGTPLQPMKMNAMNIYFSKDKLMGSAVNVHKAAP